MFSNGSNNYSCALPFGFFGQHASHRSVPLSSSRWLIGSSRKMKSNGWQRARMKATRCCCPKDNFPAFSFTFSAIPSVSKKCKDFFFLLIIGESVLQLNVFQSRQLGKMRSSWNSMLSECFSQFYPLMNGERADIAFIKVDNTLVIVAISVDIAAQRKDLPVPEAASIR